MERKYGWNYETILLFGRWKMNAIRTRNYVFATKWIHCVWDFSELMQSDLMKTHELSFLIENEMAFSICGFFRLNRRTEGLGKCPLPFPPNLPPNVQLVGGSYHNYAATKWAHETKTIAKSSNEPMWFIQNQMGFSKERKVCASVLPLSRHSFALLQTVAVMCTFSCKTVISHNSNYSLAKQWTQHWLVLTDFRTECRNGLAHHHKHTLFQLGNILNEYSSCYEVVANKQPKSHGWRKKGVARCEREQVSECKIVTFKWCGHSATLISLSEREREASTYIFMVEI